MILLLFLSYILPAKSYKYLPENQLVIDTDAYSDSYHILKYGMKIEEVPHHVLIVYGTYYCSGSLIGSRTVITAASCFVMRGREKVVVKVGSTKMTGEGSVIEAKFVKTHEYYKRLSDFDNDIAMVYLVEHVTFGPNVKKATIVESDIVLRVGISTRVTGYADSHISAKLERKLISSSFIIMSQSDCKERFGALITKSTYCARYLPDRRLSDNGGGATFRDLLVGILVAGGISVNPPHVAIFTNVSYFNRWIYVNIQNNLKNDCRKNKKHYSDTMLHEDSGSMTDGEE